MSEIAVKAEIQPLKDDNGAAKPIFKCQYCANTYKSKSAKNKHERDKHKEELAKDKSEAVVVEDESKKRPSPSSDSPLPAKKANNQEKDGDKYPPMPDAVIQHLLAERARRHVDYQNYGNGNAKRKSDIWEELATS